MAYLLTKSDFRVARECVTKLYYRKARYPSGGEASPYQEMLADGGYMVQKLAQLGFRDGTEVSSQGDVRADAARTAEALAQPRVTLFEATLLHGDLVARVDILIKDGDTFDLIEVKAKSWSPLEVAEKGSPFRAKKSGEIAPDWRDSLEDVTYQVAVLGALFPDATIRPWLMLVNKDTVTSIDQLSKQFHLHREPQGDTPYERIRVEFTGDAGAVAAEPLLARVDVRGEVASLLAEVTLAAAGFTSLLAPRLTRVQLPIDSRCKGCEFRAPDNDAGGLDGYVECWGDLGKTDPHLFELVDLGHVKVGNEKLADHLLAQGKASLLDVPESALRTKGGDLGKRGTRQWRQITQARSGERWVSTGLAAALKACAYPLHFIDFETSAIALPYHAGMHPYENVAFQWSVHTIATPGAEPEHTDWINTSEPFPNFAFAGALRARIGSAGTVFMWSHHERTILRDIREQMRRRDAGDPSLAAWLDTLIAKDGTSRLVDMRLVCVEHYYDPRMRGSASIKDVIKAVVEGDAVSRTAFGGGATKDDGSPLSPYDALPPVMIGGREVIVREGTAAMRAYQEMLYGESSTDAAAQAAYKQLLLDYCEVDTQAMVVIWQHWRRVAGLSPA